MSDKIRPECGKASGRRIHRELGEPICDRCEHNHRVTKARRARPEEKAKRRADARALATMRVTHRAEYWDLYERHYEIALREERAKEGS